jgi:O-antigen/teichoic acid export membrane protein
LQLTSLIAIGKERVVFKSRLFWGVTNLVANYFLILNFGGLGAIIGTNVANACACATEEYFARKYIGRSINYFSTLRIAVIVAGAGYCSYLIMNNIGLEIGSVAQLLIAAGIYSTIVIGAYLVFRVSEAINVFGRIGRVLRSAPR